MTEPFVYTHPLLSRGYPAKTNPFFFFFIIILIIIIIFLVRFHGPLVLPTNTAQPFLGKERKK